MSGPAVTLEQQIAAVAREIAMRKAVYPKWVAAKRMSQEKADHELAAMETVIGTLNLLKPLLELEAKASAAPWESDSHDTRAEDQVYHDVSDGAGKVIFDSCNSEDMQCQVESDEGYDTWHDETAARNFKFVCEVRNALARIAGKP